MSAPLPTLDADDARRWGVLLYDIQQALPEDIRPTWWEDLPAAVELLTAERGAAVARLSSYTVATQWREARQLLNDAGMSKHSLPAAVALLLPTPRDEE